MKEKNALSTRCRLFCSDTAGSIQSPKKREIAPHVRTISLLQNAKVVSFRTIRLRVEKRGGFGAILDFFFFSASGCERLSPSLFLGCVSSQSWRWGGKSFSSSLRVSEKRTKKRAVSRKKSNSWLRSTPASYLLRLHRKKKKKKKKKSHQR